MSCGVFLYKAVVSIHLELNVYTVAAVAQLVERFLGKDEVMGPNPISS